MRNVKCKGEKSGKPTEYFCCACRQLRLSMVADKSKCKICGGKDIITGPCGSLDKDELIKKLNGYTGQ